MPRSAAATKERILDAAQDLVMEKGFSATSIDQIQESAEISRGTFFYHFPSKDDLARHLVLRYAEEDKELTDGFMARAESLARDPLQHVLIFLRLHEEMFEEMEGQLPGCLFASYSYEAGLFDADTHAVILDSIEHWRQVLGGKLEEAMERHPPVIAGTDPYLLADVAYGVLQGAFILRRSLSDSGLMARHIRQFRNYLELLFGIVGGGEESRGAVGAEAEAAAR